MKLSSITPAWIISWKQLSVLAKFQLYWPLEQRTIENLPQVTSRCLVKSCWLVSSMSWAKVVVFMSQLTLEQTAFSEHTWHSVLEAPWKLGDMRSSLRFPKEMQRSLVVSPARMQAVSRAWSAAAIAFVDAMAGKTLPMRSLHWQQVRNLCLLWGESQLMKLKVRRLVMHTTSVMQSSSSFSKHAGDSCFAFRSNNLPTLLMNREWYSDIDHSCSSRQGDDCCRRCSYSLKVDFNGFSTVSVRRVASWAVNFLTKSILLPSKSMSCTLALNISSNRQLPMRSISDSESSSFPAQRLYLRLSLRASAWLTPKKESQKFLAQVAQCMGSCGRERMVQKAGVCSECVGLQLWQLVRKRMEAQACPQQDCVPASISGTPQRVACRARCSRAFMLSRQLKIASKPPQKKWLNLLSQMEALMASTLID